MPLKNKYLKYTPEISSEIFKEIWTKLINSGWKATCEFVSISNRFHEFKKGEHLYNDNPSRKSFYINYKNIQEYIEDSDHILTETTAQEILGYDPFVKEFVFPEKWYVRVSDKNVKDIQLFKSKSNWSDNAAKYKAVGYEGVGYNNLPENYTEITFDQFQKYVLKGIVEMPEVKEVIPEYVECINRAGTVILKVGMIYRVLSKGVCSCGTSWYLLEDVNLEKRCTCGNSAPSNAYNLNRFKPSTKEAFDAQNKPKSIEKWSVGTCVLFLKDLMHVKAGYIDVINKSLDKDGCIYLEKYLTLNTDREKQNEVKWFATKSEAEKFAKTLVESVKCGNGILDAVKPKQPLKQAVHCKTQKEWDFVTEKLNYDWIHTKFAINRDCISLSAAQNSSEIYWKSKDYQILSFQEWCDLNGYKMEKEVKFEIGEWYICLCNKNLYKCSGNSDTNFYHSEAINPTNKRVSNIEPGLNKTNSTEALIEYFNSNKLASIEEIQQYLPDGHVNKITPVIQQTRDMPSEFKVGDFVVNISGSKIIVLKDNTCAIVNERKDDFRHATPEEINNHLISIRQIPMGIQSSSTSDNAYNHLISYGNKIHEEFFNPTVEFERNYDYTVNPKYKQEFNIINKTKTIKF